MKQLIVDRLDALFVADPFLKAGGVDESRIHAGEDAIGVAFTSDYRKFLSRYGGAMVGPYPIFGLARAEPMDEKLWSVVAVTRHFREQAWPGVDRWYVISMDHAGNPIGIDESGKVFSYDHDACETIEVAQDFESYLEHCLSML